MEEQTATLRRALDALNAICKNPSAEQGESRDCVAGIPPRSSVRSIPPSDPGEWRAPFVQWLDSVCALHPRAFGGVTALHLAYCEWESSRNDVPCTRETFEELLAELGFLVGEIEGTLLVSGLAFREDVKAAGL